MLPLPPSRVLPPSTSRVAHVLGSVLLTITACASVPGPGPAAASAQAWSEAPVRAVSTPATALLSAQMLPPGPAERDYVLPVRGVVHLLFSRPIDPLTLTPQQFVLALVDGRRIAPVGSFLAPGTGPEGQRSVALLIAAMPTPADAAAATTTVTAATAAAAEPFSVTITGLLHDADGRVLEGLASDIRPASAPVFAVRAEPGPPGACAGQGQALRVFWSAPVQRPTEPATSVLLIRMDGRREAAELVAAAGSARPVLDLCAPGVAGVRAVELAAGAMVDERGLAAAGGTLTISAAP